MGYGTTGLASDIAEIVEVLQDCDVRLGWTRVQAVARVSDGLASVSRNGEQGAGGQYSTIRRLQPECDKHP